MTIENLSTTWVCPFRLVPSTLGFVGSFFEAKARGRELQVAQRSFDDVARSAPKLLGGGPATPPGQRERWAKERSLEQKGSGGNKRKNIGAFRRDRFL